MPLQEQLAAKLCELSGLSNVFFCNSGLEANEAALKIARKFGHDKGIDRPEIVVYEAAFHGRSIATLSATGNPKVQAGFGPLVEGFVRVPLNDAAAIEKVARTNPNVVAIFLEVIQGEGGIRPTTVAYLQQVRRICDEHGWLLMLDEVQCGMGRTGKWFAHQWAAHPARRDAGRQGAGLGRAGRRRRLRPARRRRARPGQPRHDLRRQPAGDARRRRDPAHHRGRAPARERRQRSAPRSGAASSASSPASPASSRCAARA